MALVISNRKLDVNMQIQTFVKVVSRPSVPLLLLLKLCVTSQIDNGNRVFLVITNIGLTKDEQARHT